MFNNLWKRKGFGKCWWINPKTYYTSTVFSWYKISELTVEPVQPMRDTVIKPMRLEKMTPFEIREAVKRDLICFVPAGVIENHGNQCPVGCDAIESEGPLLLAGLQADAVIAPTVWYGPTGYDATGPDLGTINIDGDIFRNYISGVISGIAAMGFKKIIIVQVHQGPNGPEWLSEEMAIQNCRISSQKTGKFTDISVMGPPEALYDHAGKNETSWMLYYRPDNTDLSMIRPHDYMFCWEKNGESNKATYEWGKTMSDKTVSGWVELINKNNKIEK
jgi:creatinine amidohydrolase